MKLNQGRYFRTLFCEQNIKSGWGSGPETVSQKKYMTCWCKMVNVWICAHQKFDVRAYVQVPRLQFWGVELKYNTNVFQHVSTQSFERPILKELKGCFVESEDFNHRFIRDGFLSSDLKGAKVWLDLGYSSQGQLGLKSRKETGWDSIENHLGPMTMGYFSADSLLFGPWDGWLDGWFLLLFGSLISQEGG